MSFAKRSFYIGHLFHYILNTVFIVPEFLPHFFIAVLVMLQLLVPAKRFGRSKIKAFFLFLAFHLGHFLEQGIQHDLGGQGLLFFDVLEDGNHGIDTFVGTIVLYAQIIVGRKVVPFKKIHDDL